MLSHQLVRVFFTVRVTLDGMYRIVYLQFRLMPSREAHLPDGPVRSAHTASALKTTRYLAGNPMEDNERTVV